LELLLWLLLLWRWLELRLRLKLLLLRLELLLLRLLLLLLLLWPLLEVLLLEVLGRSSLRWPLLLPRRSLSLPSEQVVEGPSDPREESTAILSHDETHEREDVQEALHPLVEVNQAIKARGRDLARYLT
jgi:hypothetical protein